MLMLLGMLILISVVLWAISIAPFMDANIKKIAYIIVIIFTVIYLLSFFGMMPNLPK